MKNVRFHSPFFALFLLLLCGCVSDKDGSIQEKQALLRKGYHEQTMADSLAKAGNADTAFAHYERARNFYKQAADSARVSYTLLQQAELYNQYNDYQELQSTAVEALKYLSTSKDSSYLKSVYVYLGISFSMMDDLHNATANYYKGRSYVRLPGDLATIDNNIAYAHTMQGQYAKAAELLAKTIRTYTLPNSLQIKGTILDNYGYAAFRSGKPNGSVYVEKALVLRKASADTAGLIANYLHLAEMASDKMESINLASHAERLSSLHHAPEDRLEALRFLINNAAPASASAYSKDFIRISDSLQRARLKTRTAFAKIKYDVRAAHEETEQQEMEKIGERNEKLMWIIAFILFVFVSIIAVYYLIKRSKSIRKKATYDAEVRISTKLHDELANEVHKTIVFTETSNLSDENNKETLLQRLETIYDGTRSISRDNSGIPQDIEFSQALRDLLKEYNSEECAVIVQGVASVDWEKLESYKRLEFYRVVQELLANMRKHSKCSHAVFMFAMNGRNINVDYSDNGLGKSESAQIRKNGLRIMENRISGLKGTVTFESMPGNGFRAHIQFPL